MLSNENHLAGIAVFSLCVGGLVRMIMEKKTIDIKSFFFCAPYAGELKFTGQPTGLLYALSVLANRKYQECNDCDYVRETIKVWNPKGLCKETEQGIVQELQKWIKEFRPSVVGISTFSVSYKNALKLMRFIKEIDRSIIVVFGGAHEDNYVSYYVKNNKVDADFVFAGDGMYMLDKFFQLLEERAYQNNADLKNEILKRSDEFEALPGAGVMLFNHSCSLKRVQSYGGCSERKSNPISFDEIPLMPRYLLIDERKESLSYTMFGDEMTAQVMLGQGCPHSCPFCSEGIKKVWYESTAPGIRSQTRDIEKIELELDALYKAGYRNIFFDDSTMLAKPKYFLKAICSKLKSLGVQWGGQTTLASVYAYTDLLSEMYESGMRYLYLGIEHFHDEMIDSFGKKAGAGDKYGSANLDEVLKQFEANKIKTAMSLTFGHQNSGVDDLSTLESKDTVVFAIDVMKEYLDKYPETVVGVSLNIITYHPGTIISENFEKRFGYAPDFIGHPNLGAPFEYFEEGVGPHVKGVEKDLVQFIWSYSKETLKDKLLL